MTKSELIEKYMEDFMHENPYGDSRELAAYMYEKGRQDGYVEGYETESEVRDMMDA